MGASWSASGSGAGRTYSFVAGAAEPGTKSVSAANGAGDTASSDFTVSADSAAPTTTILCSAAACLNGTYYTSAPVSVTLSANDGAGSGVQKIRYTTDGTDPTPVNGSDYSGAISINSTATVKFRAYDNLGNEEPVGSQDILLDGRNGVVTNTSFMAVRLGLNAPGNVDQQEFRRITIACPGSGTGFWLTGATARQIPKRCSSPAAKSGCGLPERWGSGSPPSP